MQIHISCTNADIELGWGFQGTSTRVLDVNAKMDTWQVRDAIMEMLASLSEIDATEAIREIAEQYVDYLPQQVQRQEILNKMEELSGNSPSREPRDYPSVGFDGHHRSVDPEVADNAITQAYQEGKDRAWWEAGQMANEAVKIMGG